MGLKLSKRFGGWRVMYAAALIALVPATIVVFALSLAGGFRTAADAQMQRTAIVLGRTFDAASTDLLADPARLQERVEAVGGAVADVRTLEVLARSAAGDGFTVIASLNRDSLGQTARGPQNAVAWNDDRPVAYPTKSGRSVTEGDASTPAEARGADRYWAVVIPLHDARGEKALLLSAKLSSSVTDALVAGGLSRLYLWLAIAALIAALILAGNTRLFRYAALCRRLREADAMKDGFVSTAARELQAPVAAVRGYLSLFLDSAFGPLSDKARAATETTMHLATRLNTIVDELVDASRLEQGRISLTMTELDVRPIIKEAVAELAFEAEKKGLDLTYEPPAALPNARADAARLRQVVINLISNAIKYTPTGSVNLTTTVTRRGRLEIRVSDTGPGMSAEQRERLFTKFHRAKSAATAAVPGVGLGLWITKRLVELMKGRITCDSIESVGTQVSVELSAVGEPPPSVVDRRAEPRSDDANRALDPLAQKE
jgi:signal transduction histidine kinase